MNFAERLALKATMGSRGTSLVSIATDFQYLIHNKLSYEGDKGDIADTLAKIMILRIDKRSDQTSFKKFSDMDVSSILDLDCVHELIPKYTCQIKLSDRQVPEDGRLLGQALAEELRNAIEKVDVSCLVDDIRNLRGKNKSSASVDIDTEYNSTIL